MTLTREQVIEMAKAAGFPSMSIDNISDTDLGRLERFAALAFSAGRDAGLGEAARLEHEPGIYTRHDMAYAITALKGKQ